MTRAPRVGVGVDSHRFRSDGVLVLGGVEIPGSPGLDGHSDADVLVHAIVDALLGAIGAGNIGTHFPNTDPAWRGAASSRFLEHAIGLVREAGFRVGNVDATLVAEEPALSPHFEAMRRSLAGMLHVPPADVSVKATTAERMGALGRREGIACVAVVMLVGEDDT